MDKASIETKRVVSLYSWRCGGSDFLSISENDCDTFSCGGYSHVRVSEPVTITFKSRDPGEVVASQVAGIDEEILEARDRFARKLAELQERRQNLLALTAPVSQPVDPDDDALHPNFSADYMSEFK
jgi:hypothetical protein